jgi:hypothetical protein
VATTTCACSLKLCTVAIAKPATISPSTTVTAIKIKPDRVLLCFVFVSAINTPPIHHRQNKTFTDNMLYQARYAMQKIKNQVSDFAEFSPSA